MTRRKNSINDDDETDLDLQEKSLTYKSMAEMRTLCIIHTNHPVNYLSKEDSKILLKKINAKIDCQC